MPSYVIPSFGCRTPIKPWLARFKVLGFRVKGFRVQGFRFRAESRWQASGFRVSRSRSRISKGQTAPAHVPVPLYCAAVPPDHEAGAKSRLPRSTT